MLKIEKTEVFGWEAAIRGMRNPMNSWDKSDSNYECGRKTVDDCMNCGCGELGLCCPGEFVIGENDHALMMKLAKGGSVHAKYRRMINVTCDITAPLYWWKEFDTYKVGTVANSCSTMHKIHSKEFTLDDFSLDHCDMLVKDLFFQHIIPTLNLFRKLFLESKNKKHWYSMIQLLPTSYNQKRTVQLNYEVLVGLYKWRKDHKLDEWHEFCDWVKSLPHSELIIPEGEE